MDVSGDQIVDALRSSLRENERLRATNRQLSTAAREPVAIVAMGCRFPGGVESPEQLWRLVESEIDAVAPIPPDRGWDIDGMYDPDPGKHGKFSTREGGYLVGAGGFDPAFFGISPREALAMDPQQRLLLEVAWETFERAGIDPLSMRGERAGVYVGAAYQGYGPSIEYAPEHVQGHLVTGISTSVISGRVAYVLGLEGPAITVDTACSSSLVAMHLACQALRSGECTLALAGGATVIGSPMSLVGFSRQGALAADGRCKAFGADADGMGPAEGVGLVLLERLSDARRNGHPVLALVRGTAINQDGASNGLSAPSGPAQQRVIRQALANARLEPSDIDVVEAHGTGTALGDPIEAEALLATYGRDRDQPLWLGSLKSNIGHAQTAAGVGGVIKMVQALRNSLLPRTLHADRPSEHIDWASGKVELLRQSGPWPESAARPRRAAVSSFGVSGTNAHAILEQAPPIDEPEPTPRNAGPVPWMLSGRGEAALRAQAERVLAFVADHPELDPADVGHALAVQRAGLEHRAAVIGETLADLVAALTTVAAGGTANIVSGRAGHGRIAFVFPGQGSQWPLMARELLADAPAFAEQVAACDAALRPFTDWSVLDVLTGAAGAPDLSTIDVVQPVLFTMMVSLAAQWRSIGITPTGVVGHSQGEIAAAFVAGALSLDDAARVVALRSQLWWELRGKGGVLSVGLPADLIRARLVGWGDIIGLAAVNSPVTAAVSGDPAALDEFAAQLAADGIHSRRVPGLDTAGHSAQVEVLRERLLRDLAPVTPRSAQIPFYSTVTGALLDTATMDAEYWYRNMREPVEFELATRALLAADHDKFVEVAPHPMLRIPMFETFEAAAAPGAVALATLARDDGGPRRFITAAAELAVHGGELDWGAVFGGRPARIIDLPTYPFQREHFWLDRGVPAAIGTPTDAVDGLRYRITWRHLSGRAATLAGTWLLVVPEDLGDKGIVAALAEHVRVVTMRIGRDETDAASLGARLDRELAEVSEPLAGVISLLALDESPYSSASAFPVGAVATVALLRALGARRLDAPLWAVTSGAVAVDDADALRQPLQAQAWGIGRIAALEYPQGWGGLIDLPETVDQQALNRLVGVLAGADGEDQVAIRSAGIFGRRLVRPAPRPAPDQPWRPSGTVLVTGGTGGLGAHVARWLVAGGAEHVVLTGRRGSQTPGVAELCTELTDRGSRVTVAACDIADRGDVARLLDDLPELTAVIHAAGVVDDGLLDSLTPEHADRVIRPKVDGARHLHELTADRDLSAFVLFSSFGGVLGAPGQGAYAAANAYLDALAQYRRGRGLPATSVAWAVWGGGGGVTAELARKLDADGVRAMRPEQAIGALQRALDFDETCSAVADIAWDRLVATYTSARPGVVLRELPDAQPYRTEVSAADSPADRLASLDDDARAGTVTELVRSAVADVLGYTDAEVIDFGRAFRDLGFDSLTAVNLRNRLVTETGLRLPVTLVFDYPTAAALTGHLLAELGGCTTAVAEVVGHGRVSDDPIAIIGMACRFPGGVQSPEQLWDLVANGVDAVGPFPRDRGWDVDGRFDADPDRPGTYYATGGCFLYDAADFDPAFFGISPREALTMDPQQRLLLETAWESFERAGIDPAGLAGSPTGVFVGASYTDYGARLRGSAGEYEGYLINGSAGSVASGRVAYTFGFEGPAVTVDTACSSSLVAMHLAAQSLRNGESSLALAGGVVVMSTMDTFVEFSRQRLLAGDGRCKAFGAGADGAGWGEGVGLVLLERLSDAQRNGHAVLAVVAGSAVNQDGASNGLTAPNGPAQQRVIRQALANAGLTPADVDLVEAHGTGTRLGDPIEAQAILATYGRDRPVDRPVRLGTVKSNIGHTQAAAGIAGVIKVVQAIRNAVLPKTLHADSPSPEIDWAAGNSALLTDNVEWAAEHTRRAGVSSFGVSGTNVHVIIAEAEPRPVAETATALPMVPWVLSARSPEALRGQAGRLLSSVEQQDDPNIADIGYSLAVTRSVLDHRAAVVGGDLATLRRGLADLASGATPLTRAIRPNGRTAVLFPGQGAQWLGMGQSLYAAFPVFAAAFDAVLAELDFPLREVMWGADEELLARTDYAQVGLFAVEVALFRLLESWGVRPDFVMGHSIGELVAAHVAGVWSLADAVRVVVARGRLMAQLPAGGVMVAVEASEDEVVALLSADQPGTEVVDRLGAETAGGVEISAVNGPLAVVLSGAGDAVAAVVDALVERGCRTKQLRVSHAFHSAQMEPMLAAFEEVLAGVSFADPVIPVVSNVTGSVSDEVTQPGYWVRQVREAVRFGDGLTFLAEQGVTRFVEAGPGSTLSGLVQAGTAIPLLRRNRPEPESAITALGSAHVDGCPVDWRAVFAGSDRVDLPTYAFQRQRFWLDAPTVTNVAAAGLGTTDHPLLGAEIPLPGADGCVFTGRISLHTHPWLADHQLAGAPVFPGTALLELVWAAAERVGCSVVEELTVQAPLTLPDRGSVAVVVTVGETAESGARPVTLHGRARETDEWTCHAIGTVTDRANAAEPVALTEWPPADALPVDIDNVYRLDNGGYEYGPTFQGLRAVWRAGTTVYAEVALPPEQHPDARRFGLHPALLDAACQTIGFAKDDAVLMPFSWHGYTVRVRGASTLRVRLTPDGESAVRVDLADQTGHPVGVVTSLALRPATAVGGSGDSLYRLDWRPCTDSPETEDAADYAELGPNDPVPAAVYVRFPATRPDLATAPAAVRTAVRRALGFIQKWLSNKQFAAAELVFVTASGVSVSGEPAPDLANAAVWGLVRAAQTEHPGRFFLADVGRDNEVSAAAGFAVASGEPQLAFRDAGPLAARLVRVPAGDRVPAWDTSGSVLVTGATGTLGRLVARHLVQAHGIRYLLLAGRRGVQAPGAAELATELAELGATAQFVACDVTERDSVAALLADVPADHPLTAIVHTAGVLDDGVVEELTDKRVDHVLRPKLDAVVHLHELTRDLNLAAFVVYSSLAGTFGGMGQANYAAGNAFLDAFAQYRRDLGLPAQSLAWGLWGDRSAMTGKLDNADLRRIGRAGILPFTAEVGLAMFDAAIGLDEPVLIPTRLDLGALRATPANAPALLRDLIGAAPRRSDPSGTADPVETLRRDLTGRAEPEQTRILLDLVRRHAGLVLGYSDLSPLEPERGLLDLGFDSLTAVELRNGLAAATGLRLPATLLFDYPTPLVMARHLRENLTETTGADVSDLAELEALVLADGLADAERTALATRLRGLLTRLESADGVRDRIEAADDNEIFDFIDNDLGVI